MPTKTFKQVCEEAIPSILAGALDTDGELAASGMDKAFLKGAERGAVGALAALVRTFYLEGHYDSLEEAFLDNGFPRYMLPDLIELDERTTRAVNGDNPRAN